MGTLIKNRQDMPDNAKFAYDLCEKFGFKVQFDFEYPVPPPEKRVQIRAEAHVAPREEVKKYATAMKRGDKFPPLVVSKDGCIVDGNTRDAAAHANNVPYLQALILDEHYEGGSAKAKQRMHALGAAFNVRNGKGIDKAEIRGAIEHIGMDPLYDATRIAALIGVSEGLVRAVLSEKKARQRAQQVNIELNNSLTSSQLRRIGQTATTMNDGPFTALLELTQDASLKPTEISALVKQAKASKSDQAAMDLITHERETRRDQIATYKASGKSRTSAAVQLRQKLGYIIGYKDKPFDLAEHNPSSAQLHLHKLEQAIDILNEVVTKQTDIVANLRDGAHTIDEAEDRVGA
jgi:hypothetical protein